MITIKIAILKFARWAGWLTDFEPNDVDGTIAWLVEKRGKQ